MNNKLNNELTEHWWKKLAEKVQSFKVQFLVGDFNMSLTQVVPRLRKQGLQIDCCSWYPWLHTEKKEHGSALGMDSCAIFYIGGNVSCDMPWQIDCLPDLLQKAAGPQSRRDEEGHMGTEGRWLDTYSGNNVPGQMWNCYKSKRNEKSGQCTLKEKLEDLLRPSTTKNQLGELTKAKEKNMLPAFLRLKQKPLDKKEWLVNPETGQNHHGAHFPLFMVTRNSGHRSEQSFNRRRLERPFANQPWAKQSGCLTAVAAQGSWWTSAPSKHKHPGHRNDHVRAESLTFLQQRAQTAEEAFDELDVDQSGGAESSQNRGGGQTWGRSDWDWSGSHWDWSDHKRWW